MKSKGLWAIVFQVVFGLAFVSHLGFPDIAKAEGKPIIIGCPVSMSVFYGPDCRDAQLLAIKEINAAGGVKVGSETRPLKLVVGDTRAMEPGVPVTDALLAIERLITEKKADFLIGGPVRSEASFAARDMVNNYKKIWIVTTGTYSPQFGDGAKYPFIFRLTGDVSFEIKNVHMSMLKHFRNTFNFNKIYIMVQDVKHARAAGSAVAKLAANEGFEILGEDVYPTGTTDFSMGLLSAKNKGANILFIWMDMPELTILAKQYYDFKIPALPFGYMGPAEHVGWWSSTEKKGEYFIVDLLNAGNAPSNATPWTMKFVEAFTKEYGREPDAYGISTSYMGVYLLKNAIELAGTLDADLVRKALKETDLLGVYGRMRFNENNEIIFAPDFNPQDGAVSTIVQWQNGKRVTIFPETIKMGEIMLPSWFHKRQ
ncbi:ABC transporter substrate-binding protein [Desulfatiglans anilini]|uniref:ABC transporter substrate-binding protein n=1 Tax=Desulfatiglans anilini TaxID=90728 RepID=UPI00040E5318|nr:ABC transporter substrate-binding protein [Desulfatiglans anilini]